MAVRLSALRVGAFYPQEDSWCSFLSEDESTPRVIVRLEELGQLKNPMPQPTMPNKLNDIYNPDGIREFSKWVLSKSAFLSGCGIHLLEVLFISFGSLVFQTSADLLWNTLLTLLVVKRCRRGT
jgi:hypothetical protein